MRKATLLSLLVVLLVGLVMPVSAQMEAQPACTEEELAAAQEAIAEPAAAVQALGEAMAAGELDPTSGDFGATVVEIEALSSDYWTNVYPEFPACKEAQANGLAFGLFIDSFLRASMELNVAGYAENMEDAKGAEYFVTEATTRTTDAQETMSALQEMGGLAGYLSLFPACTEEELAAFEEQVNTLNEAYTAMNEEVAAQSAEMADVTILVANYVAANEFSKRFDDEVASKLTQCLEVQSQAIQLSLIYEEGIIIRGLTLNAAIETELGNTETAEALSAAAEARVTALTGE